MVSKTLETKEVDGKGKIIIRLNVLDKKYELVKLYLLEEKVYGEALAEAKEELSDMIAEGLPEGVTHKIKYSIDERAKEQTEKLRKEDQ